MKIIGWICFALSVIALVDAITRGDYGPGVRLFAVFAQGLFVFYIGWTLLGLGGKII